MALTTRGKKAIGAGITLAVAGVAGLALAGKAPAPLQGAFEAVTGVEASPPTCPLTDAPTPDGADVPRRPLLAVKVENTDDAYPLSGLDRADVVYEEVVEGGITRFVAIYHCRDAKRIGPVRSARTTDPKILAPFQERPVLAFAGAAPKVDRSLAAADIVQLTDSDTPDAFTRDDGRVAPHNLFTSTAALWRAASKETPSASTPQAVFTFSQEPPERGRRAGSIDITFSSLSSTGWVWEGDRWTRLLDGNAMTLESGAEVRVDNVVVQLVKVTQDTIVDASGAYSPVVQMTGTGKAWVFRDGRVIVGRWERNSDGEVTTFLTRDGGDIPLSPGVTWVELVPTDGSVAFSR